MTTTVTIELTDDQVEMLRSWGGALTTDRLPPEEGRSVVGAVIRKAYAALPPEPLRLTIELPADLADASRFDHEVYSGGMDRNNGKRLQSAEAAALTAVVKALKDREARQGEELIQP